MNENFLKKTRKKQKRIDIDLQQIKTFFSNKKIFIKIRTNIIKKLWKKTKPLKYIPKKFPRKKIQNRFSKLSKLQSSFISSSFRNKKTLKRIYKTFSKYKGLLQPLK